MQKSTHQILNESTTHGQFCARAVNYIQERITANSVRRIRKQLRAIHEESDDLLFKAGIPHISHEFNYKGNSYAAFGVSYGLNAELPEELHDRMDLYLRFKAKLNREVIEINSYIRRVLTYNRDIYAYRLALPEPVHEYLSDALEYYPCNELFSSENTTIPTIVRPSNQYDQKAIQTILTYIVDDIMG